VNLKCSRREISHCISRQLGGSGLKHPYKPYQVIAYVCVHAQCAATICYLRGHSDYIKNLNAYFWTSCSSTGVENKSRFVFEFVSITQLMQPIESFVASFFLL